MAGLVPAIYVLGPNIAHPLVMPGLVPGIHALPRSRDKDVDGRDKPGHDAVRGHPHYWTIVSYRSFHSGLLARIKRTFHVRDQCFMLCSRWIAA
jgi:hypothetical protein